MVAHQHQVYRIKMEKMVTYVICGLTSQGVRPMLGLIILMNKENKH